MKKQVFIPTKLLSTLENTPEVFFIDDRKSKLKLINKLIELWYFIFEKQDNINLYTNIYRDDLRIFNIQVNGIRYEYTKLLEILEFEKLIDINKKYQVNSFTKSYRILTNFITNEFTEIELDVSRILKDYKDKEYWLKKYPSYKKQINDVYNIRVDIYEYLKFMKENENMDLKPYYDKSQQKIVDRVLTAERINDYIYDALKINFGNLWFKVSDNGRFYNSFTNLSYTALDFIKLNRREVVSIDGSNFQPLLLATKIENKEYKKAVETGKFYDMLSEEMNISRDRIKIMTYRYIFFNDKQLKSGELYECMKKLFGSSIDEINAIKNDIRICDLTQKMEAEIFVNFLSNLKLDCVTRHDEILVYEEDYNIVRYKLIQYMRIKHNLKINVK